ncbi:MAG: ribose-5-phosphate isomerase RpiA [Phycisphaerae bacterium]|nr:ribose-5-phosphate isomerase RpiA [Phycisphaerae bacterium]
MGTTNQDSKTLQDELKKKAALAAVEQIPDHSVVGLGSGSTLAFFIHELGRRVREGRLHIVGVPTSFQARMIAAEYGMTIRDPMEMSEVDVAVDGADEVDPKGNLIKGAGAAHVMEKIVASMARRFVIIVDESKMVNALTEKFAVPLEVVAPSMSLTLKRLREMGGEPTVRTGSGKMGPVISDFGNLIIDVKFQGIADPAALDVELNNIPGVVGHGLFIGMANQVIVARIDNNRPALDIRNFR